MDPFIAYRIGRAYAKHLDAKSVVVGSDARLTSNSLKWALAAGLIDGGVEVIDIGLSGTEEVYFATMHWSVCGGIEVTASHNPIDYNGMKLVRENGIPISGDTGLNDIKSMSESFDTEWITAQLLYWVSNPISEKRFMAGDPIIDENKLLQCGKYKKASCRDAYVEHLMSYISPNNLANLKVVVNAGNGAAGPAVDAIARKLVSLNIPIEFIKVHHQPDGSFPNGIPNPMLVEGRKATQEAVKSNCADFGVAWDGDFDRCFLFDHTGRFIDGYYIVGLLADAFLTKDAKDKVVYDPRLYWNTLDIIEAHKGKGIMCKTGHAFIKERMRDENAVYGGEMSAHHYFRDFSYCDSGMIPWLLIANLMREKRATLAEMVAQSAEHYPTSGEINIKLTDPDAAIAEVKRKYETDALASDFTDGIGFNFENWRFNLRKSNTEPLLRLNIEAKGDTELLREKTSELLSVCRV